MARMALVLLAGSAGSMLVGLIGAAIAGTPGAILGLLGAIATLFAGIAYSIGK